MTIRQLPIQHPLKWCIIVMQVVHQTIQVALHIPKRPMENTDS